MKTLKHSTQNVIAVVTETTVYLSDLEGRIYKHFPVNHFNSSPFTTEVEFPSDFEVSKSDYNKRQANVPKEKEAAAEARRIALYEARKEEIINIWSWRKGQIDAFRIRTNDHPVELFGKNPNIEGNWENVFFGTYEDAKEIFDDTIGSWTPEFDNSINNVQGEVCLYKCDIELSERLAITSLSDLKEWFDEFNNEPIEDEFFSKELPEKGIIIETVWRRGNFNKRYQEPSELKVVGDSTGSYTNGYRKMTHYSDLWDQIVMDDLQEFIDNYRTDESAELIRLRFTRDEAIEYGLSEIDAEWIYEEKTEEEE